MVPQTLSFIYLPTLTDTSIIRSTPTNGANSCWYSHTQLQSYSQSYIRTYIHIYSRSQVVFTLNYHSPRTHVHTRVYSRTSVITHLHTLVYYHSSALTFILTLLAHLGTHSLSYSLHSPYWCSPTCILFYIDTNRGSLTFILISTHSRRYTHSPALTQVHTHVYSHSSALTHVRTHFYSHSWVPTHVHTMPTHTNQYSRSLSPTRTHWYSLTFIGLLTLTSTQSLLYSRQLTLIGSHSRS